MKARMYRICRWIVVSFVLFSLGTASPTAAATWFQTGVTLNDNCRLFLDLVRSGREGSRSPDDLKAMFCLAYVLGVIDSEDSFRDNGTVCIPGKSQSNTLTEIVSVFLRDHPELRQYVASDLVVLSLRQAFPCE